ncbi:transcriptional regulator with XRE-family HTH domain [Haloferula luteola]|uniref:Transcriptional regulator with XRE-family HTH domain n=1 Tax=Haloferula luteola TaxID=595692 RepID=A0A840V2L6_9BACT|nr:XRE family transcriptional regulator [Haloferula luteola]MBB5351713.1 transcriptional regulator with XRE-family HTH domain [Haloferula luteola]
MPDLDSENLSLDFAVIRNLRKQAGLTLQQVSDQSGLSVASLSKLERNQNLIELPTLHRLARVFGLSASDLLSLAESATAHRKKVTRYQSGPFNFEKLAFQGVELFHATARAGDSLQHPEAHGDEHEICWVRKGRVHIAFSHEQHTLAAGDALKFDAVLPHTYEIQADAELIIAHLTKTHRF